MDKVADRFRLFALRGPFVNTPSWPRREGGFCLAGSSVSRPRPIIIIRRRLTRGRRSCVFTLLTSGGLVPSLVIRVLIVAGTVCFVFSLVPVIAMGPALLVVASGDEMAAGKSVPHLLTHCFVGTT